MTSTRENLGVQPATSLSQVRDSGARADPRPVALPVEVFQHYNQGREDSRLRAGRGRLEYLRTQDVLRRLLPGTRTVLDVGGGTGIHAEWLIEDGHDVTLVDPMPLHRSVASMIPSLHVRDGDARSLDFRSGSFDAVLLMGPLYHLTDEDDRRLAWSEACRVVVPGGLVIGVGISRWATMHDMLARGPHAPSEHGAMLQRDLEAGQHRNPQGVRGLFTTTYLHRPEELRFEAQHAGLSVEGIAGIEGAAWLMDDLEAHLVDDERRDLLMDVLRTTENEPSLLGVSGHLMCWGRRPMGRELR